MKHYLSEFADLHVNTSMKLDLQMEFPLHFRPPVCGVAFLPWVSKAIEQRPTSHSCILASTYTSDYQEVCSLTRRIRVKLVIPQVQDEKAGFSREDFVSSLLQRVA